jgi:hypothetical protein
MRWQNTLPAIVGAALATGCFVEVQHVDDPSPEFVRARAEAARVQGRPGPAHTLHVLAFDRGDHELTKVSLPFWIVKRFPKGEDGALDLGDELDDKARGHLQRRWRLDDLEKAGLGTLVEVEEQDGDQVLVWLR